MVDISPKLTWKINQYRRKCNFEYNLRQRPFIYILGRLKYKKLKYLMMEQQSFFDKQWNRRWYGKINIGHSLISMMVLAAISFFLIEQSLWPLHISISMPMETIFTVAGVSISIEILASTPTLWVCFLCHISDYELICTSRAEIRLKYKSQNKIENSRRRRITINLFQTYFYTFLLQFWTALNI